MAFAGKKALITGVSRGIGAAVARAFRAEGALVAGMDLNPPQEDMELFVRGDAAEPALLERFVSEAVLAFGRVDYLINNAMRTRGGIGNCGYEDFMDALRVGVAAPYWLTRLLAPHFAPGACVVNISSTRAFQSHHRADPRPGGQPVGKGPGERHRPGLD